MKIAILGIGGVGGYFGGLLAKHYQHGHAEINFIARGENEKVIAGAGLRLQTMTGNLTAFPRRVSNDPAKIGRVDLIIVCTKGYDLEDALRHLKPCLGNETIILPLLNGIDARERIQKIYPECEVWDGCVYLVARLGAPGVILETGNVRKLFFGSELGNRSRLSEVENIFRMAGIEATWSENIAETIWEKYLFISPIATLTSYLDKNIQEIFDGSENENLLNGLLSEVKMVAEKAGISLPENTTKVNIDKMRSLPPGTTSSMHSDFRKGVAGRTELESLTGHVIRLAEKSGIDLHFYKMMYEKLAG